MPRRPRIPIEHHAPSAMARDLSVKFADDLRALVHRSSSLMVPEIGVDETTSIILSVLAMSGVSIQHLANAAPGAFAKMVRNVEKDFK
jgi:hypothetical protein